MPENAATKTTHAFQTEARQLLDLMIHSLYSNKEIFLRELISNASDACDKLRFEALTDPALLGSEEELAIEVRADASARTITVSDTGIGMSHDEVIDNIGTIARSGTREFVQQLTGEQVHDAQLIGQFGVGFYSSFIVADRVTLTTRRAGLTDDQGVRWESTGEGDYTLETVSKPARGTEVTLHLREDEDELLDAAQLRSIVLKYSNHISIPIRMAKARPAGKPLDTGDTGEGEQVNSALALWTRSKSEIAAEQYDEFYKSIAHDIEAPLAHTHVHIEGRQDYTLLLYLPRHAPFDLWDPERRHGVKLYVRRVFIMDGAKELLPGYLRFIRGIIDSNDLPLNVSRESLQHSSDVDAIRNTAVKRVLACFEELAEKQPDTFTTAWNEFGRVLKEGIGEDPVNRERIAGLLRFASTHADTPEQSVSLAGYVERMQEGQQAIYYVTADSFDAARQSPHLEVFRKKGVEVLLLHDRVDEWVVSHLPAFGDKPLQSVAQGALDLADLPGADEESQPQEATETDFQPLAERMQQALGERAAGVRVTHRLTESPACLVSDAPGMSANLERILRAAGQAVPNIPLVLEINPTHPIVTRLKDETDDDRFQDWSHVLFDQSMLAEGGHLADPASFVKRLNRLLLEMAGEGKPRLWTPPGS